MSATQALPPASATRAIPDQRSNHLQEGAWGALEAGPLRNMSDQHDRIGPGDPTHEYHGSGEGTSDPSLRLVALRRVRRDNALTVPVLQQGAQHGTAVRAGHFAQEARKVHRGVVIGSV